MLDPTEIWTRQLADRERRGEFVSSSVMAALLAISLVFLLQQRFALPSMPFSDEALYQLAAIIFAGLIIFALIAWAVSRNFCPPWLKYVTTFLQLSLASTLLAVDLDFAFVHGELYGPTAIPFYSPAVLLVYGLAIALTAFRLSPGLALFAVLVAAIQFATVNQIWMRPLIHDRVGPPFDTILYGWNFILITWLVMGSIGVAAALSARSLLKLLDRSVREAIKVDRTQRAFGRYVSEPVARRAMEEGGANAPSLVRVAVIFADIESFTSYAERVDPEHAVELLNRAWSSAIDSIEEHGGFMNKFLGDGFLAVFGAPTSLENPGQSACDAARDIFEKVGAILAPENLRIRLGLHAGDALAGEIGSGGRCEYTVMGATINTASRIEQVNKETGTYVLASGAFVHQVDHAFSPVAEITLRGSTRPEKLFCPDWASPAPSTNKA